MRIEVDYHPSGPQRLFHESDADEILYGGAAGGGKSAAIVIDALIKASEHPGAVVYCFRRTCPQLDDTLITEMRRWYPDGIGRFNQGTRTFFLRNGSQIRFRHCQHENDKYNYQGAQMSFLYIDELTHFTESIFDYLSSRVRTAEELGFKPQVKCSSNPGGEGHTWVKARFVTPFLVERATDNKPATYTNEIKRYKYWSDYLQEEKVTTRQFIPAYLKDNPHLNDDYVMKLEMLPDKLKRALLYGDWDIFVGQAFMEWANAPEHYDDRRMTHVINPFEIPPHWKIFRGYDFGQGAPYSVLWWAIGDESVNGRLFLIKELYGGTKDGDGLRETASQQAEKILQVERIPFVLTFKDTRGYERSIEYDFKDHGFIDGIADPSIWANSHGMNESVASVMESKGVVFRNPDYDPSARKNVVNNRLQGKQMIHEALRFNEDGFPQMQVFKTCPNYIKHLPEMVIDPDNPEDVLTKHVQDHEYDATRYTLMIKKPQILDLSKKREKQTYVHRADPLGQAPPRVQIKAG